MAETEGKARVKPLFLIAPGSMTPRDIRRAERECGICIAECKTPESVRLLEPPLDAGMDIQARAALELTRMLINHDGPVHTTFSKAELIEFFTQELINQPQPQTVTHAKQVKK